MTRARIVGGALAVALVLLALVVGFRALRREVRSAAATPRAIETAAPPGTKTHPAPETSQGFLYGRVTTLDGATYEGRLRWGGSQEAFWGDFFDGTKRGNPWLDRVPPERRPKPRRRIAIFGIELGDEVSRADAHRRFLARFGDIARIEARGRAVRVKLKSGTAIDLDRLEAGDFDDGVRVLDSKRDSKRDAKRGVVDLDSLRIRTIELLPTARLDAVPYRLYGTVRTARGDFTGFVQWDWENGVGSDELEGRAGGREVQ